MGLVADYPKAGIPAKGHGVDIEHTFRPVTVLRGNCYNSTSSKLIERELCKVAVYLDTCFGKSCDYFPGIGGRKRVGSQIEE
jgi:hypothetical protein